jgi:hypothetical protein
MLYYTTLMLGVFLAAGVIIFTNRSNTNKVNASLYPLKNKHPGMILILMNKKLAIIALIFDLGVFSIIFVLSVVHTNLTWRQVFIVVAGAVFSLLWTAPIYYAGARIYRLFESSIISPDLNVVGLLAESILSASVGKPSSVRDFSTRKKLSANMYYAANLLDRSTVRLLGHDDRALELIVRPQLDTAAYGLRQSVSLLALSNADAMERFNTSLGKLLIGVVTGDLSQLAKPEISAPAVSGPTWQDSLFGLIRWFALALGAPLAVILAVQWKWIPEGPTQSLALQFAVLCFIYASFSALGQSGRDELSGVVSSGTSLFGWGKSKD